LPFLCLGRVSAKLENKEVNPDEHTAYGL